MAEKFSANFSSGDNNKAQFNSESSFKGNFNGNFKTNFNSTDSLKSNFKATDSFRDNSKYIDNNNVNFSYADNNLKNSENENGKLNLGDNFQEKKNTAWAHTNIFKIYKIMQEFSEIGVDVHCPQFLIIGDQSVGKTSLESQLVQMPIGVMKNGTGTRQVTRLKMINNQKLPDGVLKIKCAGQSCANEEELSKRILARAASLEQNETFEKNILEIEIEGKNVPTIVFVDSIGLISSDQKQDQGLKKEIDSIVGKLLNETDDYGRPRYVPVIIVKAQDSKNINNSFNKRIDKIINDNPNPKNGNIYKDWKLNSVFIVNGIDQNKNYSSCAEWIETFRKYKEHYKNLIVTMANPYNDSTGTMDAAELTDFVISVPDLEMKKWQDIKSDYRGDENLDEFGDCINKYCGVELMKKTFGKMMTDKVFNCLDTLEQKINLKVIYREKELQKAEKAIEITLPGTLNKNLSTFTNKFISNHISLYNGLLYGSINDEGQNFQADLSQIYRSKTYLSNEKAQKWQKYYFRNLKYLKDNLQEADDTNALAELDYDVHSGESIYRLEMVWKNLVALMEWPKSADKEIRSAFHRNGATKSGDPFECLRNILLHHCEDLENAANYLAESVRVLIQKNLKKTFDFTYKRFLNKYDNNTGLFSESDLKNQEIKKDIDQDNLIQENDHKDSLNIDKDFNYRLLSISYKQLKKQNDFLIDTVLERFSHIQKDLATILTKHQHKIIINIGKFFDKIIESKTQHSKPNEESKQNSKKFQWNDKLFFKEVYSRKHLDRLQIPFEDINAIIELGKFYWIYFKYKTIEITESYLNNDVIQHLERHEVYQQAAQNGAIDVQVDICVQKLNKLTGIASELLKKEIVKLDKYGAIEKGLLHLDPKTIAKECNIDYEYNQKRRDILAENLNKLKTKKEEGLAKIEILRHH